MMVAVGRLQLSVSVAPTENFEETRSITSGPDLERAFRADQCRKEIQADRERMALRYRTLGGNGF